MASKMLRAATAALLLCGSAGAVHAAQSAGPDGRTVYEAAYFSQFAPSNALQVVQRVPGFTLELGNQEVRGFGQAAGNVVINGQRPSSKSDTLETILARIPASRVAVGGRAGRFVGSDFPGNRCLSTGATVGAASRNLQRPAPRTSRR